MEENQILDNSVSDQNGLFVTNQTRFFLDEIRKWTKFFAIMGFIGIGLMVVAGLTMGVFMNSMSMPSTFGGSPIFLTIIYLIMAILYIMPVLYLNRFSNYLKTALESSSSEQLQLAFENLKSHFKFVGIIMIVILSIYAVVFLFAIVAGVGNAF